MQNNNDENNINNSNLERERIKPSNKVTKINLYRDNTAFGLTMEEARMKALDSHLNLMVTEFSRANGIKCVIRNITFANTLALITFVILCIMKVISVKIFLCIMIADLLLMFGINMASKLAINIIVEGGVTVRKELATLLVNKVKGVNSLNCEEYELIKDELLILMGLSKSE